MAAIDVSGGGGAGISLTKDIFVNTSLIGAFDATDDVNVFLQDPGANPITPVSSVLVGNDLTITANIPNPSGVSLQRPNPSQAISSFTYDTGWRVQNTNFFNYTPPAYPAKYAQLNSALGVNQWYKLKTALTVGGVTSTERFVDINGVQSWGSLNNANFAVIDKLTGLMFTRSPIFVGSVPDWINNLTNAFNFSITINSVVYSNWYMMSSYEMMVIMGRYLPASPNWTDLTTSQNIATGLNAGGNYVFLTSDTVPNFYQGYVGQNANVGYYSQINPNVQNNLVFWIHDASNLIS